MPGSVFISYSRVDRHYVVRLARHLTEHGFEPWFDHEIVVGEAFWRRIQQEIDTCSALLVVLTPSAVASPAVSRELAYADEQRKSVLPMLLKPCPVRPIELSGIHAEDVRNGGMPSASFLRHLAACMSQRSRPRLQHVFDRPSYGVESLAWQPEGDLLASGNGDMSISLFNSRTGHRERVLYSREGDQGILDDAYPPWIFWSPDGSRLASWTSSGCGRPPAVWDARTDSSVFYDPFDKSDWDSTEWLRVGLRRARRTDGFDSHDFWRTYCEAQGLPTFRGYLTNTLVEGKNAPGTTVETVSMQSTSVLGWSPPEQRLYLGTMLTPAGSPPNGMAIPTIDWTHVPMLEGCKTWPRHTA